MSDFDFDEIDKAVAGAISNDPVDTSTPSSTNAPEATPNITDTSEPSSTPPVQAEPAAPIATEASPVTPRPAPAARRSSGRFMDVVHPSSDMRSPNAPASFTPPVAKPPVQVPEAPALTVHADLDDDDTDKTLNELDAVVGEWSKPLDSPFLADAKVEKRPLGGSGASANPVQASWNAPIEELLLEAPEEELLLEASFPDPIDFAAQSAAPSFVMEDTGTPASQSEPAVESVLEKTEPETPFTETKAPEVLSNPEIIQPSELKTQEALAPEVPVGPTSITQQYTEQPGAEKVSGAIFDTENYHQPLAPVGKKHSGVWAIVWILLLVILGAGAGVGFYLFVLPML